MKLKIKKIFDQSIFGALFTLWMAPIDEPKLKLPKENTAQKGSAWFSKNLIIGYRP